MLSYVYICKELVTAELCRHKLTSENSSIRHSESKVEKYNIEIYIKILHIKYQNCNRKTLKLQLVECISFKTSRNSF